METSNTESNQASSLMVSEHETRTKGDLKVHSLPFANKLDVAASSRKLDFSPSSSSSSPESPLENPFQENNNEPDKSPQGTTTPVEVKEDSELASGYSSEDNISKISTPKLESPDNKVPASTLSLEFNDPPNIDLSSDNEATTVSPPTQVMERESKYRIPSSVFARTKSNAPVDWSVASNESLFSIQMGNMSFIKEDFFWKSGELGMKSGELGMKSGELEMRYGELGMRPGELDMKSGELGMRPEELTTPAEPSTSVQMFSYSQPMNTDTTDSRKSAELGVAVETMKEVLRECADDQKEEKSVSGGRIVRNSDGSTSSKSFVFSAGVDKSNSLAVGSRSKFDAEKSVQRVQSQSNTTQEQKPKSSAATATPELAKTVWFSWFSCRPFC